MHLGRTFAGSGWDEGKEEESARLDENVILTVICKQKGSVHYCVQGLPQQEAGVMRWFQVQQALEDGQQLDGDRRPAHLEDRAAFHHRKAGSKQSVLTLPLHDFAPHMRACLLY